MKFEYFQGISLSYSKPLIDGMHEKKPWLTFDLRSNSSIVAKGIFFFRRENQEILSEVTWFGQFIQGTQWLLGPPMSVDLWGRGQWRKRETLALSNLQ